MLACIARTESTRNIEKRYRRKMNSTHDYTRVNVTFCIFNVNILQMYTYIGMCVS